MPQRQERKTFLRLIDCEQNKLCYCLEISILFSTFLAGLTLLPVSNLDIILTSCRHVQPRSVGIFWASDTSGSFTQCDQFISAILVKRASSSSLANTAQSGRGATAGLHCQQDNIVSMGAEMVGFSNGQSYQFISSSV